MNHFHLLNLPCIYFVNNNWRKMKTKRHLTCNLYVASYFSRNDVNLLKDILSDSTFSVNIFTNLKTSLVFRALNISLLASTTFCRKTLKHPFVFVSFPLSTLSFPDKFRALASSLWHSSLTARIRTTILFIPTDSSLTKNSNVPHTETLSLQN